MTIEDIRAAANAAAEWWRGALEQPRFDNGDDSRAGGMAVLMALTLQSRKGTTGLDAMVEEIRKFVTTKLELRQGVWLSVDYGPDSSMSAMATASGFRGQFPWKTSMQVSAEKVEVSCGYRAPWETLWQKAPAPVEAQS